MSITVGVKKFTVSTKMSPFLRESRFQNLGNFFGCNPEYRTSTPESLKRLDSRTQVPLIKDPESGIQNLESEFHGMESTPSKTVLHSLSGGDRQRTLISLCVLIID